jgi:predicted lipoprotein with Yx(FWY)xxD motif
MVRAALPALSLAMAPVAVWAQASDLPIPVAASDSFPAGIAVKEAGEGHVYVNRRGLTLYGMDMRAVTGRTGRPALYCTGDCLAEWEPLRAPPGSPLTPIPRQFGGPKVPGEKPAAKPIGDWLVMEGPVGPQWVYKQVHMVFTHKGDRPGSVVQDGQDSFVWNTLKYVPPVPKLTAPANVTPRLVKGAYVLADMQGHLLFTPRHKDCADPCKWRGFASGMARRGMGEWTVRQGEDQAQWVYRGKPVYLAEGKDMADIPAEAVALTP